MRSVSATNSPASAIPDAEMENDPPTVDAKLTHEWSATPRLSTQKWLTNEARPPDPQLKTNKWKSRGHPTVYTSYSAPISKAGSSTTERRFTPPPSHAARTTTDAAQHRDQQLDSVILIATLTTYSMYFGGCLHR